jgi:hypothetical protein
MLVSPVVPEPKLNTVVVPATLPDMVILGISNIGLLKTILFNVLRRVLICFLLCAILRVRNKIL